MPGTGMVALSIKVSVRALASVTHLLSVHSPSGTLALTHRPFINFNSRSSGLASCGCDAGAWSDALRGGQVSSLQLRSTHSEVHAFAQRNSFEHL